MEQQKQTQLWKDRYYSLLRDFNLVESQLTEEKISYENLEQEFHELEEDGQEKLFKIEDLENENICLDNQLREAERICKRQRRKKIEARKEIGKLKKGINDLIKENIKFVELLKENQIEYEEQDESKCCKLCYKALDNDHKKVFQCTNEKCGKQYHLDCLLKINYNKNICPYCKVTYNGYNFESVDEIDSDYEYESEDSMCEIEYNRAYNYTVDDFRIIDIETIENDVIIKIQSSYRGYLVRRQLKIDRVFALNTINEKKRIENAYNGINNRPIGIINISNQ